MNLKLIKFFIIIIFCASLILAYSNVVLAKRVISVGATISETPLEPPPSNEDPTGGDFKLSCPKSFEINGLNTVSRLSIPNQNIIIRSGGKIKSFLNNIRLDTDCDLIILDGGEISVDGDSGGFITLSVGGNIRIAGKITAKGLKENGGFLRIDAGKSLVLDGEIDASGVSEGGFIRGDIKGDLKIKNNSITANSISGDGGSLRFAVSGNLVNTGNFTANGISGGLLRIDVDGNAEISGTTTVNGQKDGGQIRFSAKGKVSIAGNSLLARGLSGSGGIINLDSGKDLTISGFYSADGKNGGSLLANSKENILISSGAIVSAVGTSGNGGAISFKAVNTLAIHGQLKADGASSSGRIDLSYCFKDFSGAQFNPQPNESAFCFNILPSPSSSNFSDQTTILTTEPFNPQENSSIDQNQNNQEQTKIFNSVSPRNNQEAPLISNESNKIDQPAFKTDMRIISPPIISSNFQLKPTINVK